MRERLGGHPAASQRSTQPTTRARSDEGRGMVFLYTPVKAICHCVSSVLGLQAGALAPALVFPASPIVWLQQPPGWCKKSLRSAFWMCR